MFFLKELPTKAMISRYSEDFFPDQAQQVSTTLEGLRQYSLLIRKLEEYFAQHNLSQLRFLTLMVIDRELTRDYLYAYEITQRLDVSKPVLSRAISKLIDDGLLCATKDEKDGRAVVLSLTPQSKDLLKSMLAGYFAILANQPQSE